VTRRFPRAPLLGGRTLAAGVWIDPSLIGESQARARVVSLLDANAAVLAADDGYLLLFGTPRVLYAETAPGLLIAAVSSGGLSSCDLTAAEQSTTPCKPGQWLRARQGRLDTLPLAELARLDPAAWVEVGRWTVMPATAFGPPKAPVSARVRGVAEDVRTSVRELLGDKAPNASPERGELLSVLEDAARTPGRAAAAPTESGWLASLFAGLFGDDGSRAGYPQLAGGGGGSSVAPPPPQPGLLARLFRGLVERSPLSRIIGRKQAQYLERTLSLFEGGDIDEALRHAVPFSSLPGAPKPPSLCVPSPRASLNLSAIAGPAAASSLNLGEDLYERFKSLYARAAKSLEADGRIEEAAYVYFELLDDASEGIALLERHEAFELAASMAHGRGMEPGLVIRLWCLAKKPEHAVLVAKRTGAFADAIARLESQSPRDALRLRLIWADRLAQAGHYEPAVQAIWPAQEARHLARAWVDRAIEYGGESGARMLARKLSLWRDDPAAQAHVDASILALVSRDDPQAAVHRRALAESWVECFAPGSKVRPILSSLVRRLMLDDSTGAPSRLVEPLLSRGLDPVLISDIRRAKRPTNPAPPSDERPRVFHPSERGLLSPLDAVVLPNGRLAAALGEAGLRILDAGGRTLRTYHRPTSELILADSGRRLIGLHPRGDRVQLSRVDLESGRLDAWAETRLDRWCRSYDGATWYVAVGDRVVAIDVQDDDFEALWSVGGLPSPCHGIARSPSHLRFATTGEAGSAWVWTYQLTDSGPVLRGKTEATTGSSREEFILSHDGTAVSWAPAQGHNVVLASFHPPSGSTYTKKISTPTCTAAGAGGVCYGTRSERGVAVVHLTGTDFAQKWSLEFPGSDRVGVHRVDDTFVVFDALGRIVIVDTDGGIETTVLTRG